MNENANLRNLCSASASSRTRCCCCRR